LSQRLFHWALASAHLDGYVATTRGRAREASAQKVEINPQDKSGSATGLTIPRGLGSRVAVKLRRYEAIPADLGFEW
jgi:hypothetical protein